MKTISSFLALMNSLMAGVIIAFSLSQAEVSQSAAWWAFTKVVAALVVIGISMLTWLGNTRRIPRGLLSLGSLSLAALGAATALWTVHLGLVRGDMEFYMLAYGGSLIVQGVASLFGSQIENVKA